MAAALKASPTAPKSQGQKELSGKKSKETSELVRFQLQQDCCLSKQIAPKQRTNSQVGKRVFSSYFTNPTKA